MAKPRTSHKPETSRRRLHILFQKQEGPALFDFLGALPIGTEAALVRAILIRWYETTQASGRLHSALSELLPFDRQAIGRILTALDMPPTQQAEHLAKSGGGTSQADHSNFASALTTERGRVSESFTTVGLPDQAASVLTESAKSESAPDRTPQNILGGATTGLATKDPAHHDLLVGAEADDFFTKLGLDS
jgi:hypothetical protein